MNHFGTSGRKEKRLMKREVKRNWREKILCVWGENERERGGEEENEG